MFGTIEEFGWSVPACNDVGGHGSVWVGKGARETEIGEFELTGGGNE